MINGIFARMLALGLACVLLSSCSLSLSTQQLLTPPRLTQEQSAIYDALEKAIGTADFKLKYPRRGQHMSACVLFDADMDQNQEAVAFYELSVGGTASTWISLLKHDENGWRSIKEIPGYGSEIDMVDFAPITDKKFNNIIVGWTSSGQASNYCTIYSYDGNDFKVDHEIDLPYNEIYIDNVDDNDLKELVLCTTESTKAPAMRLVKFRSGRIVTTSEIAMPKGTRGYSQITFGALSEGMNAVFADIILDGGISTTRICIVDKSMILDVSPEDLGIYESFDRPNSSITCKDINNDGLIDIPIEVPLPGYTSPTEGENLKRTDYMSVVDGALAIAGSVIINHKSSYQLVIPPSWRDTVTVVEQPNGEWWFCTFSGTLSNSTTELLRIKVVSPGDYQDKLETVEYFQLAVKGVNKYMAYIPSAQYPGFSITTPQLAEMFSLTQMG